MPNPFKAQDTLSKNKTANANNVDNSKLNLENTFISAAITLLSWDYLQSSHN